MSEVFLGDTGTKVHFTVSEAGVPVNISGATTKTVKFARKDKTVFERDGEFETDGTDGKLLYTSTASDFNQTGKWTAQAYLVLPTWAGHTSKVTFDVLQPLVATP